MPKPDPRIDAYIASAAPFAQPILTYLRALVHRALPSCEEGIKWGMPHFMIGGKNVAGMAAFKAHCAFVIHGEERMGEKAGMGGYGKITALDDLPDEALLIAKLGKAVEAQAGVAPRPRARRESRPDAVVPDDFAAALAAAPEAQAAFDSFAPSYRREYCDWIGEAKQPATRDRRIAQAVEWLGEGKKRNWKYDKC